MPFGKIYDTSNFGSPVENGWGGIYYDLTEFEILAEDGNYLLTEDNNKIILE